MNMMMVMKKILVKKMLKKDQRIKNMMKIMKIIYIKTINIITAMTIMDIKVIIHMVQGNIGKRKEININMKDTQIKTSKNTIQKN